MEPMFITLEGGEGAGKSSQMDRMAQWLERHGHRVVTTREPGGTPLAELIRDVVLHGEHPEMGPMTELLLIRADGRLEEARIGRIRQKCVNLLLIFAARAQHVHELIRPSLSAGKTVLCDRFSDASFAYQGGGRQLPVQDISACEALAHSDLQPDLTFLLDVPVGLGLSRARGRGSDDRFESESLAFLERVRQTYLERAKEQPARFEIIDASQDEATVWAQIQAVLERRAR